MIKELLSTSEEVIDSTLLRDVQQSFLQITKSIASMVGTRLMQWKHTN